MIDDIESLLLWRAVLVAFFPVIFIMEYLAFLPVCLSDTMTLIRESWKKKEPETEISSRLGPCPLCGCRDTFKGGNWEVHCPQCGVIVICGNDDEEMVKMFNTRSRI